MTTKSENFGVAGRALYDLAALSDCVDEVGAGLATMQDAITANASLADALGDVSVPTEKKAAILQEIFSGIVPEALAFALISIERNGVYSLGSLVEAFDEVAAGKRNIVVAEVTTAAPLSDAARTSLKEKLSANVGKPVTLRERVDASLLGGIRINISGRVLDGSLAKQLAAIRVSLTESSVGGEA